MTVFTTPVTWAASDTPTAAQHNVDIRDNALSTLHCVALNTTEQTMAAVVAADLVTLSGLSIPAGVGIVIFINYRKSANANTVGLGLKLNATTVVEAVAGTTGMADLGGSANATHGICRITIPPRRTNYLNTFEAFRAGYDSTLAVLRAPGYNTTLALTAAMPTATITDIIIRGICGDAAVTLGVQDVWVGVFGT